MQSPEILAYTVADACKALGIGRTNLYTIIAEGRLEARSLGGRTVIPASSLRAFVENLPPAPIRLKAPTSSSNPATVAAA